MYSADITPYMMEMWIFSLDASRGGVGNNQSTKA